MHIFVPEKIYHSTNTQATEERQTWNYDKLESFYTVQKIITKFKDSLQCKKILKIEV